MKRVKIGIIGCGNICDIYFMAGKKFRMLEIAACADLLPDRAREKALKHGVAKACSVDELLDDPDIEIVVNLTVPHAHADVAMAALKSGKHIHSEKPLAVTREDGMEILSTAKRRKLRVGCAPDTFLGGGLQTCRKLIDDGWIGRPIAATAFMMGHGHEHWHPDPGFFYQPGAGPMFDMGPYYLTALITLLGPVKRVCGSTGTAFPSRTVTSEAKFGDTITVNIPTHVAGTLDFDNGAIATMVMSFDVWGHHLPCIEIHGTEGSMVVPDPNGFGGQVLVRRGSGDWKDVPHSHGYTENSRGIGVADMACGLLSGRAHRASGLLAYHVLDIMHAFHDSSDTGKHITIESACDRPAPLPMGLREGELDP